MDAIEPPSVEPVDGVIMLVVVFLLRELGSGALKEFGKDAWGMVRAHRLPEPVESADTSSGKPQLWV